MDQRGGGGGDGNKSHTDLLAAGRKKLQQFRKKKGKKGPGRKAEADADAEEGVTKAGAGEEEAVSELSPVGLKFLAGEGGISGVTLFETVLKSLSEEQFAASHEIPASTGRGDTDEDADGAGEEAVQQDAGTTNVTAEGVTTYELSPSAEKSDPDLFGFAIPQGVMPQFENILRHLYLTTLSNDFLQLQLDECADPNTDVTLFSAENMKLQVLLKETEHRIDQLAVLNIQLETEVPVLRDGLQKLVEALESSRTELEKRSSELEQSEQKFSSVKEKLGIAIAKGKGLIVQRDTLKQSLLEKSGELELLSQELQSKDALLKELEAKLKSCTEADRIEALESELSYIRNSATALRDSFLLKDSVLQKIEEVLEDLDLSEHFHSRDIVEKIELLSRMAVGSSFTVPDGDKKSSVDGYPESGTAMDNINDEQNSNSNPGSDEMQHKYDELQRRFYELAEHNNMLEQSLVERNNVILKWEEMLGQISIPPQFRMSEPEDRIAWLGNKLLEVEHERDALHLKTEQLEDSSEMLITDLEESHRRISELSAEVSSQNEVKKSMELLLAELNEVHERAEHLQEELLKANSIEKEIHLEETKLSNDAFTSERGMDNKEYALNTSTNELEHAHNNLALAEQQRDEAIEKSQSLIREVEVLIAQINQLQEGSAEQTQKYQSLVLELETVCQQRDNLQAKLHQEEQKYTSLILEVETLHAEVKQLQQGSPEQIQKYQALVLELESVGRQRDDLQEKLNQEEQKCTSLILEVETLHAHMNQLQEGSAEQTQKYQPLVVELESVGKQWDHLQEKLNQEEQKCTSLILEVETLHAQMNQLQEGGAEHTEKHQSLVLELETVGQQRDNLQEKLNQKEQKCISLILEVETLHAQMNQLQEGGAEQTEKYQSLVLELETVGQQRDNLQKKLNQEEQKCTSLTLEVETLHAQMNQLQEGGAEQTEKYQSLVLELETLGQQRDNLQEKLNQEEQKCTSLTLEVETLLAQMNQLQEGDAEQTEKYQSHVLELETVGQQRNNLQEKLHQEEQKYTSLILEVETLHAQMKQLQEGSAEQTQKYQSLVLELESVGRQRDDLQEKLNQEERKCTSLILEVETLHAQMNQLQDGGAEQTEKHQSLVLELESVGKQRDDLQQKLNQEEQKCTSLREKLNVAVRKGKSLVQHRDSLKQTVEGMNAVIEELKNERKQQIESLESEKSLLMGRLTENEKSLHDTTQYLSRLLNALGTMDIAREFDTDPFTKVEKIAEFCIDLQALVVSSQNEVMKSKQATELLLTELNEAHDRADNLQEELVKAEAALSESSKQNNAIDSARADAVRHLEHNIYMQAHTRRKQIDHLKELSSTSSQLREVCFELSQHLVNAFSKDVNLICYMGSFMKCSGKWMDGTNMVDIPISSNHLVSNSISSKKANVPNTPLEFTVDDTDDSQILHHLAFACRAISDCVKDCNDLKRNTDEHGFSIDQKATELFDAMSHLQNRFTSQNNELGYLRENIAELQSQVKEKEEDILSVRRNMSLLYEACTTSVSEIEGMTGMGSGNRSYFVAQNHLSSDGHIKSVVDRLLAAVKTTQNSNEGNTKELKASILELQQELQGKDVQISTISAELSSHIRKAESSAKQFSVELEDARMEVHDLGKRAEILLNQKKALETQISELKDMEAVASEQHRRIKELIDELSRKDQEIEGLTQALDEEEKELEVLENKNHDLEQMLQEKEFALKSLEVSRSKALTKLATTVDKFDELHSLSENLLIEVESLQSQLQERDSEISFLRQEVTRSTNELLIAEESNKKYSSQMKDFIEWLETILLQFGVHCESRDDSSFTQLPVYKDMLDKKIGSLLSESDDLRVAVQNKDSLLQVERTKMEELLRKSEALETSLSQKDPQQGLLRRDRTSGQPRRSINLPGTSEIEQMNDKVSPPAVVTQIRGARKVNNDQIAIDIEVEKDKPLDDEDDDKAHGFKSLTMSRIVPKFTRPISDRIDGMWVSGDRLLMRQPTLRLGVLIYWIVLHALLASFV